MNHFTVLVLISAVSALAVSVARGADSRRLPALWDLSADRSSVERVLK